MTGVDDQGTNQRLLRLAHSDSEQDWSQLLRQDGGMIRAVARDYLNNEDQVDDAVQNAIIRLRRALPQYQPTNDKGARAFLRRIVACAAQDLIKAERRRRRREMATRASNDAETNESPPGIADPELAERVESSLRGLPKRQQQIIELHYFHGLSFGDVAQRLEITPHHTHVLHGRAIKGLRRRLVKNGAPALSLAALCSLLMAMNKLHPGEGLMPDSTSSAAQAPAAQASLAAAQAQGLSSAVGWLGWGIASGLIALVAFSVFAWYPTAPPPSEVIDNTHLPKTGEVVHHIQLATKNALGSLAYHTSTDVLWVTTGRILHRVRPSNGQSLHQGERIELAFDEQLSQRIPLSNYHIQDLAWHQDQLWLQLKFPMNHACFASWDPARNLVVKVHELPKPGNWDGLAAAHDRLWTIDTQQGDLLTIDQATGQVLVRASLPKELALTVRTRLAYADQGIWLSHRADNNTWSFIKLDPDTAAVLLILPAPSITGNITGLCPGDRDTLWALGGPTLQKSAWQIHIGKNL